jgi:uncharacterized protein (TIGR03000 family)
MYSMVLMAALTTGTATPACHWSCHGCHGCYGGCHGCHGCYGGGCYGGCSGCYGGCSGCYGGCYGCYGGGYGCHGCYGGTGCYGCAGCYGYAPAYVAPVAPPPPVEPGEKVPAPKKTDTSTTARLVVELPVDAKLFIDGNPMKTNSAKRTFNTPPLQPGQAYYYMLRAEVVRDGQTMSETSRVIVRAGEVARASFAGLESKGTATAQASGR